MVRKLHCWQIEVHTFFSSAPRRAAQTEANLSESKVFQPIERRLRGIFCLRRGNCAPVTFGPLPMHSLRLFSNIRFVLGLFVAANKAPTLLPLLMISFFLFLVHLVGRARNPPISASLSALTAFRCSVARPVCANFEFSNFFLAPLFISAVRAGKAEHIFA